MERKWHGGSHLFIHFMSICITKLCWVVHRVFVLVSCNISVEEPRAYMRASDDKRVVVC